MNTRIGLCLARPVPAAAPALAWTEEDLRAAELESQARAQEWKKRREREAEARKQALQEGIERIKQVFEDRQKRHEARRAAKLGARLYDRADMVSMRHDAMKDLRGRDRIRQQRDDHEEPRKSIAERDAEDRAAKVAELERRRQQKDREDRQRQQQGDPSRRKSIAELDAEHKDATLAKLERMRSMPKGDRQQEQTDRKQERSEERAQARERGAGDRDTER